MRLKIAGNTLFQVFGKIISSAASFIITILLARTYGPNGYGDYEKIISFVSLFYLLVDFGFNAIVINKIKKMEDTKENLYGLTLAARLVFGILIIFLCLSLLPFLPGVNSQGYTWFVKLGIILISITILLPGLITTNNLIFQENLRYDKSIIASSLSYIILLIFIYLITFYKLSILFALVSYSLFFLVNVIVSFCLVKRFLKHLTPLFNLSKIISLFKETFPFGITLAFNVVYFRSDIIILSALKSTQDVAYYGLAYRFFEVALVFPTFFNNALYPVLLESKKFSIEKIKNIFLISSGFLLGAGIVASIFLIFLSPLFISFTSSSFSQSITSLRILSLSLPIFYLTSLFMWFLIAFEKQKLLAPIYGFTMVLNILLNLIFIPRFSYLASSAITGIAEIFILLFTGFHVLKIFKYNNNKINHNPD